MFFILSYHRLFLIIPNIVLNERQREHVCNANIPQRQPEIGTLSEGSTKYMGTILTGFIREQYKVLERKKLRRQNN